MHRENLPAGKLAFSTDAERKAMIRALEFVKDKNWEEIVIATDRMALVEEIIYPARLSKQNKHGLNFVKIVYKWPWTKWVIIITYFILYAISAQF